MSGYRLMRVCMAGLYRKAFERFLAGLGDVSYEEALQRCRANGYLYPGGFRGAMGALGVEVREVIVDLAPLQERWASENGFLVHDDPATAAAEVFFSQLAAFQPEVVYFQSFDALPHAVRREIKARCPSVALVAGHRGSPLLDAAEYLDVDAVFLLGDPWVHDTWRRVGITTFRLDHCFDESLLPSLRDVLEEPKPHEFTYLGSSGYGIARLEGRYRDLCRLLDETGLEVWVTEPEEVREKGWQVRMSRALSNVPSSLLETMGRLGDLTHPVFRRVANAALRRRHPPPPPWYAREQPLSRVYPDRVREGLFGIDYLRILARSKLTWNRHLDVQGAGTNMRLYEACGVGTCQLVDDRPEVAESFEPGTEVVVYQSLEECIDKARFLLSHDAEREQIALAGRRRALADHSVAKRAVVLHARLKEMLGGPH